MADPSADQRLATKMGTNTSKVFIVYLETDEFEALPRKKVRQWGTHKASLDDLKRNPKLPDAVQLAEQAMSVRA